MADTVTYASIKPFAFYIISAINNPNGAPHTHSQEMIAADVVACYHRLLGEDSHFCMVPDATS